jgi:hypothetical protein
MRKRIILTVVSLFLLFLSVTLFSRGDKPETEFPQLSAEVNYAEVEKRIEWTNDFLQKEKNFHGWFKHPAFKQFNNVPNYEGCIVFFYGKFEDKKCQLGTITIRKKSPKRSQGIDIGFHDNGTLGYYEEFILGCYVTVRTTETGKLSNISFENLIGEREIKFDDNRKILTDTYKKFNQKSIQIRLENKQQMDDEIRASIAVGNTDAQKKEAKEWQLKLPEKIKDRGVRSRLLRIGEYHQAVVAGNSHPLVENPVFDVDAATFRLNDGHIRLTAYVFYSGKKVTFVGVEHLENFRDIGYFMMFDEHSRLQKYVEGEITFNLNQRGYEVAKSAKLFLRDRIFEKNRKASGIEITFHPTGYPASYKTIVKGNLFGRQAEWNDKGEVIFDEDYDIPKLRNDLP